MKNDDVFASLHFCGFEAESVVVEGDNDREFVTITCGQSRMVLSGRPGIALALAGALTRQVVEREQQETEA